MEKLNLGDNAQLKSGGPNMRVSAHVEDAVLVEWPIDSPTHWDILPAACLTVSIPKE